MSNKKFSTHFWLEVRSDFQSGMSQIELRRKYKLSKGALGNKIARDNWRDLDGEQDEDFVEPIIAEPEPKIKEVEKVAVKANSDIYSSWVNVVNGMLLANIEYEVIARAIGVSLRVFESTFQSEIETTLANANAKVVASIFASATDPYKPNPTAQKLWVELQGLTNKAKKEPAKEVKEAKSPFSASPPPKMVK